jgi:hypothetical protein
MWAFVGLNDYKSTVTHGMENVKNHVKSQTEVETIYKTNI